MKKFIILIFFTLFTFQVFAEGSAELMINEAGNFDSTKSGPFLAPNRNNNFSGTYQSIVPGNANYRINIRICNVGEVINMAFWSNTGLYFRLYKPDGNSVQFNTPSPVGPGQGTMLSESGTLGAPFSYFCSTTFSNAPGAFRDYIQAKIGPSPATGLNGGGISDIGYTPIQYITDMTGDYYLVFDTNPDSYSGANDLLKLFDVTVWNNITSKTIQKARLYSRAWSFWFQNTATPAANFNPELFMLSNDGVVTATKYNQMRAREVVIIANSTGFQNTGNIINDRRLAQPMFSELPEYPVFLNDPTISGCFPIKGTPYPSLNFASFNGTNIDINMNQNCTVEIALIFPSASNPPVILPITTLTANVTSTLPWDGNDSRGNAVVASACTLRINTFSGITHIPIVDCEDNPFGFKTRLVAPASSATYPIMSYWDDRRSGQTGATANYTTGFAWNGYSDYNTGTTTFMGIDDHYPLGYTNNPANGNPPMSVSSYCLEGMDPSIDQSTLAGIQSPHIWTGRGTGTYLGGSDIHNTWFAANIIEYALSTAGTGTACTFTPPTVKSDINRPYIGPIIDNYTTTRNVTICASSPTISLKGTVTGLSGIGIWSIISGAGSFGGSPTTSTLTTSYTIAPADTNAGFVRLRVTSFDCPTKYDTITINLLKVPNIVLGADFIQCKNATVNLTGHANGVTTATLWTSSLAGTFSPNATSINSTFTLSPALQTPKDTIAVTFTLASTANSGGLTCPQDNDQLVVTFYPFPDVDLGINQKACTSTPTFTPSPKINNIANNPGYTISWITTGGGSFSSASSFIPTYSYAGTDLAQANTNTPFYLKMTATSAVCGSYKDSVQLTLFNAPNLRISNDTTLCNSTGTILGAPKATSSDVLKYFWVNGTGSFSPSATAASITYSPTAAERLAGIASVVCVGVSDSVCALSDDTIIATLYPSPSLDALSSTAGIGKANNQFTLCNTALTTAPVAAFNVPSVYTYSWSTSGTGTYTNGNTLSSTYTYSATDTTLNLLELRLTATSALPQCSLIRDTIRVNFIKRPAIIVAPTSYSVCADTAYLEFSTVAVNFSSLQWSATSGTGSFPLGTTNNTVRYIPSATDINNGGIIISIQANGNSPCVATSEVFSVLITPAPAIVVNAGANLQLCKSNPIASLNGLVIGATSIDWSTSGTGSFTSTSGLSTNYQPSTADTTSGTVQIFGVSTGNGMCKAVRDTIQINYISLPAVNAGLNDTVCTSVNSVAISASLFGSTNVTWTSQGTGTFSAQATNSNYTFSASDKNLDSLQLNATIPAANGCPAVKDSMFIYLYKSPIANAGPDDSYSGFVNFQVNGSTGVSGTTFNTQWNVLAGGGTLSAPTALLTSVATTQQDNTFELVVTNPDYSSCISKDTVVVRLVIDVKIPNAFSPNKDLINDEFKIENIDMYPKAILEIYDPFGNRVFRTENVQGEFWNGQLNGKDLPAASYYYVLDLNDGSKKMNGTVSIFR